MAGVGFRHVLGVRVRHTHGEQAGSDVMLQQSKLAPLHPVGPC